MNEWFSMLSIWKDLHVHNENELDILFFIGYNNHMIEL